MSRDSRCLRNIGEIIESLSFRSRQTLVASWLRISLCHQTYFHFLIYEINLETPTLQDCHRYQHSVRCIGLRNEHLLDTFCAGNSARIISLFSGNISHFRGQESETVQINLTNVTAVVSDRKSGHCGIYTLVSASHFVRAENKSKILCLLYILLLRKNIA